MTVTPRTVVIRPRDPLIARTARPFQADPGALAETLAWPLPTTTAGAVRTHLVSTAPSFTSWNDGEMADRAVKTTVHGPVLLARRETHQAWTPYVTAPLDARFVDDPAAPASARSIAGLRPLDEDAWRAIQAAGAGCDLPHPGLVPLDAAGTGKLVEAAGFWSLSDTIGWLLSAAGTHTPAEQLPLVPVETRTHVTIDRDTQTGAEGLLYSTSGLVFPTDPVMQLDRLDGAPTREPALAMACRVWSAVRDWVKEDAIMPLGGERRLAAVEVPPRDDRDPWPVLARHPELIDGLVGAARLRLQLVTPALFGRSAAAGDSAAARNEGWLPGWLDSETLTGLPAGMEDLAPLRFRLVSAAIGRRVPVSGWSLRERHGRATRYAVPAGSVYFFRLEGGLLKPQVIERLWLRPVADWLQARRDGFGLVLPGTWQPAS